MSMPVVGYADSLSVQPGADISFKISCEASQFQASIVRLIHGDPNPTGPGFKASSMDTSVDGTYEGALRELRPGSYVRIPHRPGLTPTGSFTVHLWVWSTIPGCGENTLFSQGVVADGG